MGRPRLLDLFSGAGGAAQGYHDAGFDVVGVDVSPMPRYPFGFVQADAIGLLEDLLAATPASPMHLSDFDAIHASPVCKGYTVASLSHRQRGVEYPDQLPPVRRLLQQTGLPWVIENVPGAPMRPDYKLCGCMFGLGSGGGMLLRERWFETSWGGYDLRTPCRHDRPPITVAGHGQPSWTRKHGDNPITVKDWRAAMGISWMTRDELSQAIPPAYTRYIGERLHTVVTGQAVSA